jgi:tetratricopeptide (TPR) repeat protein
MNIVLLMALACLLAMSAPGFAAVTAEDLKRAERKEHSAYRNKFDYANSMAARLEYNTPVPIILDTLTTQISAWITMNLSHRVLDLVDAALALSAQAGDPLRRASLEGLAATAHFLAVNEKEGLARSEAALAAQIAIAGDPTEHPEPDVLISQLMTHIGLLQLVGQDVRTVKYLLLATRLLPLSKESDYHHVSIELAYALVFAMAVDYDQSATRLANAETLAIRTGNEVHLMHVLKQQTESLLDRGDARSALRAISRYMAVGVALKTPQTAMNAHGYLAEAHDLLGQHEIAQREAKRAMELSDRHGAPSDRASARAWFALSAAKRGEHAAAAKALAEAVALQPEDVDIDWSYAVARIRTLIFASQGKRIETMRAAAIEEARRFERERKKRIEQTVMLRELHDNEINETRATIRKLSNQLDDAIRSHHEALGFWRYVASAAIGLLLVLPFVAEYFLRRRMRSLRKAFDAERTATEPPTNFEVT